MPKNILGNELPVERSIAQFDDTGSRGIIETLDGRVFSYSRDRTQGERFQEECEGFRSGSWLQSASSRILFRPSGEYPFAELEAEMDLLSRVDRAKQYFLIALNPTMHAVTRFNAVDLVTDMLEDEAVLARVEPALLDTPMPPDLTTDCGPTRRKAGELLKKMIAKWRPRDTSSEMAYDVSFRERRKMSELDVTEGANLADHLRSLGADVVEIGPDGQSIGIWATPAFICGLHQKIGSVCRFTPRAVPAAA